MMRVMSEGVSDEAFRAAMASFASGVTIVTTIDDDGRPCGMTATAFCSVSRRPPLCLVCVAHSADAYPALKRTKRFAVNVLSRDQAAISVRFATHGIDKFDGVPWSAGETGCPVLHGALAAVECVVDSEMTTGDHDILVGAIGRIHLGLATEPLVYFRCAYADLTTR